MNFILNFAAEWQLLLQLPFGRAEKCGLIFKMLYRLLGRKRWKEEADRLRLYIIKQWLLIPFSLWPVDFLNIGKFVVEEIEAGRALNEQMVNLLDGLQNFPQPSAQEIVAAQERKVEQRDHSQLLRNPAKYKTAQLNLFNNMELQRRWREFKKLYKYELLRDENGMIYRTPFMEHNHHPESWTFNGNDEKCLAQTAFDAMAYEFDFIAYDGDRPILCPPSVTVTPYATVLVIPKWMNHDAYRDFVAKHITTLHNVHRHQRQGAKWNQARQENNMKYARTYLANEKALKAGFEGETRRLYVVEHAKIPAHTDIRTIRKWANLGEKLFTVK